jgi:arylsulfatase A-like enzyme
MSEQMDDNIGLVLQKIEQMGQTNDTIVVFTTDNGVETFTFPDGGVTACPIGNSRCGWNLVVCGRRCCRSGMSALAPLLGDKRTRCAHSEFCRS